MSSIFPQYTLHHSKGVEGFSLTRSALACLLAITLAMVTIQQSSLVVLLSMLKVAAVGFHAYSSTDHEAASNLCIAFAHVSCKHTGLSLAMSCICNCAKCMHVKGKVILELHHSKC